MVGGVFSASHQRGSSQVVLAAAAANLSHPAGLDLGPDRRLVGQLAVPDLLRKVSGDSELCHVLEQLPAFLGRSAFDQSGFGGPEIEPVSLK